MRRILTALAIGLFWSSLASASTLLANGFETGNLCNWGDDEGAAVASSPAHSGSYSVKMTAAEGGGQYLYSQKTLDLTTAYARFYLYVDNANTQGFTGAFFMGPAEARLYFDGLGTVSLGVWNGFTNQQVDSWTSINPRTWYLVEIKTVVSPTEGVIEEKLNGAVIASGYAINTGTDKITYISPENYTRADTPNVDVYEDDFAVSDTEYLGSSDAVVDANPSPLSTDATPATEASPISLVQ
jgi:hypothetical protein